MFSQASSIVSGTGGSFFHRGYLCFVYQWKNGEWGGNIDGWADGAQYGSKAEAERVLRTDLDDTGEAVPGCFEGSTVFVPTPQIPQESDVEYCVGKYSQGRL